ncbi:hypothetical protein [Longimicrobium sp.]|uniref:hypothetical protein n=1 Tax=Longimicrobium sp. TaxID=2029185 RepID=UPI002E30AB7D|nr:hypothetical protein [Longimicrobium sp.]HEX6038082.1 hypothetical protein [Longimicrobium sp.]
MPRDEVRLVITLDETTCDLLADAGAWLYALSSARAWSAAALPLVWMRTREYSLSTRVEWEKDVHAFTAQAVFPPADLVFPGFTTPVDAGDVLTVTRRSGIGTVALQDAFAGIELLNATDTLFTAGLSRRVQGAVAPFCALPLHGGALEGVAPGSDILLFFSTVDAEPGTVLPVSSGPGMLVDTGAAPEYAFSFHIDHGWTGEEGCPVRRVPAGTPLRPLLVRQPGGLLAKVHPHPPPDGG